MGEFMLDLCGEDGFQSGEGFGEWSTFSSADGTEPQPEDEEFPESRNEELSTLSVTQTGDFKFPENAKNGNKVNPWVVFNDCFPFEEAEKNLVMMEIPTLSQLQRSTLDMSSQSAAISSQAAHLWCHLQSESKLLRLSGPKPKLHSHSHEGLVKTLQLRQPDASADSQTTILSDLELENTENPPGALIQTKLMPSSHCQNAGGFFYQISRQWLSQYSSSSKVHPTENIFH